MFTASAKMSDRWKNAIIKMTEQNQIVAIGILNNATTTDGKSIAEYATYQEFGTEKTPPRPFMRMTNQAHRKDWVKKLALLLKNRRNTVKQALAQVGEIAAKDMQAFIENNDIGPALKPATVKRRMTILENKTRPTDQDPTNILIDTGQLQRSISYEVRDK